MVLFLLAYTALVFIVVLIFIVYLITSCWEISFDRFTVNYVKDFFLKIIE